MAIGWLTVLKSVPWTEVIANAPRVADGAKKLWNAVGKKSADETGGVAAMPGEATVEAPSLAALHARTHALEAAVTDLHAQMRASSELITALAEQNAQLVQRVETLRRRLLWLGALAAVATLLALAALLGFARFGA